MSLNIWVKLEERNCARGYSISMYYAGIVNQQEAFVITLNLDGLPYWVYQNLNKYDAMGALDDLELLPGPRGDSSWRAVLARCMLKPTNKPKTAPKVMSTKESSKIGTWEWLQSIRTV